MDATGDTQAARRRHAPCAASATGNGYRERLQRSIEFIEGNLTAELALEDVAAQANASLYHFHRLFRALVGQSLMEYIRGRRLSRAAAEIVGTRRSITEIALDYGYAAPESFLRAFRARYAMNPRAFRRRGILPTVHRKVDLLALQPVPAQGGRTMEAAFVRLDPFTVVGVLIHTAHGACRKEVSALWKRLRKDEELARLAPNPGAEPLYGVCFGVCAGCGSGEGRNRHAFPYLVGWRRKPGVAAPEGLVEMTVPGGSYATFTVRGDETDIRLAMDQIYGTWLPQSTYELSDSPLLEKYEPGWTAGKDASMEVWLPIRKGKAR